jgi:hypothetical protein
VSPVEDIVARGNEIREDDGMSPVKMMLSRLYPMELEVRFCERVASGCEYARSVLVGPGMRRKGGRDKKLLRRMRREPIVHRLRQHPIAGRTLLLR